MKSQFCPAYDTCVYCGHYRMQHSDVIGCTAVAEQLGIFGQRRCSCARFKEERDAKRSEAH